MNGSPKTATEQCRKNGWTVGSVLKRGDYLIRITAIGEDSLLFRHVEPKKFACVGEQKSDFLPDGWFRVDDKSLFTKATKYFPSKYDRVPLWCFSEETRKKGMLDAVIDKACELSGWGRKGGKDTAAFHCMGSGRVYYIHKAEFQMGLRKDEPCCGGDNEYG